MITGYFYENTKRLHRELSQIKKVFVLAVEANLLYFIWNIALNVLKGERVIDYIHSAFTGKNLLKFLVFNESPLAGHLWYLGAIFYVLLIVLLMDKLNCRKVLYFLTPILLVADLVFGKYSLLIFHREFPYIFVRNFLCVGIPYFCIGNLIKNRRWKLDKKRLAILMTFFTMTSMAERFLLVNSGMNAKRDHYISTTFLAIFVFLYALRSNWKNNHMAVIGRKYSTWLYVIHPIFIAVISTVTNRIGVYSIYRFIAPIVVFLITLISLVVLKRIKASLLQWSKK